MENKFEIFTTGIISIEAFVERECHYYKYKTAETGFWNSLFSDFRKSGFYYEPYGHKWIYTSMLDFSEDLIVKDKKVFYRAKIRYITNASLYVEFFKTNEEMYQRLSEVNQKIKKPFITLK